MPRTNRRARRWRHALVLWGVRWGWRVVLVHAWVSAALASRRHRSWLGAACALARILWLVIRSRRQTRRGRQDATSS